ncbi:PKD domain-containing protein [Blastococcus atacamensis]|uniref:PKD domain-containing protein n=1 Tax=Blastococcus atacamensis TaxID=2070508 RepID=UPI000CEC8998|nr:PKD domain-containing protein [Blastococcus atacamensis]
MTARVSGSARRWISGGLSLLLMGGALGLMAPAASADSAPLDPADPRTPVTVSADALPTVQINGVAWSQVVVGNTVYVAGKFTTARPAGAAAGTRETVRNNMLAYDIRTGELITSFAPDLNGQALAVAASPDGRRVYVGGDFNRANGEVRSRIAAYDTATGQLVADFRPSVAGQIRAIAATNDKVYFGGNISAVGSVSRTRLAAVSAANGALLPWAPVPGASATQGSNEVLAMVVTSGGKQVVVGGRFASLNGTAATGVGALDADTGATKPFAVNKLITNQGTGSAIWGLSTDGQNVYGSAYDYQGTGNLEGTFAAAAEGGDLRFVAYCKGDNYSSFASDEVLYIASHMHDCSSIGAWEDSAPAQIWKHATAFGKTATGTTQNVTAARFRNTNFANKPTPSLLNWYPTMTQGSITGQYQAGWSVTGNDRYVVYAGEFPRVNGVGQQGLVRYAVPSQAPNKVGPVATGMEPTVASVGDGAVRVSWKATSDMDNENLTYRVYRDSDTVAPIATVTRASQWWNLPTISVGDTGLTAGTHRYRITATDPFGNVAGSGWTTASVATGGTARPYADVVRADGAINHWSLGEKTGTTAFNLAGTADMTRGNSVTLGAAGALSGDKNTAFDFRNDSSSFASTRSAVAGPQTFTAEAWFKTSSKTGGRILGFGNSTSSTISSQHDRLIYVDNEGRVNFGVWPGAVRIVTSPTAYNNGAWHHVAASLSANGMVLYVDGKQVATRTDTTSAEAFNGNWRIGADNVWGNGSRRFIGSIDEVAIYPTALPADRIAAHNAVGRTGTAANAAPVADFAAAVSHLDASFDATRSTDADGTIASYAWTFGDGTSGTGATTTHAYKAAGTYQVQLTVTDDDGATTRRTGTVTVTAPPPNVAPTAGFTAAASGRTGSFDASASKDSDGTVASYAWDFGDGTTGTGVTTSHEYSKDGTYTVRLTITDDDGASATVERGLAISSTVLASDAFDRSVTGGLGAADVGGAWTSWAGAVRQSVTGGVARLAMTPGTNTGSWLSTLGQTSADVRTSFVLAAVPTGGGAMVYVNPRQVDAYVAYKARVRVFSDGTVRAGLLRQTTSGDEALVGGEVLVPGITYTPGMEIAVRTQASGTGTTQLAMTVWAAGAAEPATPTVTRTDTTAALQVPGGVGLSGYLSGSAAAVDLRFTDIRVAPVGAVPVTPPANAAPKAAFTSSVNGLTASVDASSSTDSDGTIASYSWAFGDGRTGTGVTASNAYAAAGTYTVRLTVTDDKGATATSERAVTVAAVAQPEQPEQPEQPQEPGEPEAVARDAFDRSVTGGLGTADLGGAWTSWSGAVRQSVADGAATLALTKGTNTGSYLADLKLTSADVRTSFSLSGVPTGGGAMLYVGARQVEVYQSYKARVRVFADGSVRAALVRLSGSTDEVLIGAEVLVPGLTYTPGMEIAVRVQASGTGPTDLALSVWAASGQEPAVPTLTRTDSTATLQAPGGVSLGGYLSGSATAGVDVRFTDIRVTPVG